MKDFKYFDEHIATVPGFPKEGIEFKDVTTTIEDPECYQEAINAMADCIAKYDFDKIICAEARGFIFGAPLAYKLNKGLVIARKPNKLPRPGYKFSYHLEYGDNTLLISQDSIKPGEKIVVIDGKVSYTGGVNVTNKYFNQAPHKYKYWKDTAVKIEGPAIQNLTSLFLQNWNLETKEDDNYEKYIKRDYPQFENKGVVIPYGDDAFNQEDIAENVYLHIIYTAQKYVHIMTPYVIIDNQMVEALCFAAKRGVDISIICPPMPDHLISYCVGKIYQKILMESGVKIYIYQTGFIHAKEFIADDKILSIGSINLDYRSFFHHFECH